jgi:phosphoglucosamine mutase
VRFLSLAAQRGVAVGELASAMRRYPQVMVNVRVQDRDAASIEPAVAAAVREAERALGDTGRVLLRPSGTEPIVRVMVEAETRDEADRHARAIADVVSAA